MGTKSSLILHNLSEYHSRHPPFIISVYLVTDLSTVVKYYNSLLSAKKTKSEYAERLVYWSTNYNERVCMCLDGLQFGEIGGV